MVSYGKPGVISKCNRCVYSINIRYFSLISTNHSVSHDALHSSAFSYQHFKDRCLTWSNSSPHDSDPHKCLLCSFNSIYMLIWGWSAWRRHTRLISLCCAQAQLKTNKWGLLIVLYVITSRFPFVYPTHSSVINVFGANLNLEVLWE